MESPSSATSQAAVQTLTADGANSADVDPEIESHNLAIQSDDSHRSPVSEPHSLSGAVDAVVMPTSNELAKESVVIVGSELAGRGPCLLYTSDAADE